MGCVCVFPTEGPILQEQQKGIYCLTPGPRSTAAESYLHHRVVAASSLHEAKLSHCSFRDHEWFCCLSHCSNHYGPGATVIYRSGSFPGLSHDSRQVVDPVCACSTVLLLKVSLSLLQRANWSHYILCFSEKMDNFNSRVTR